jgi:hypothetical protein
VVPGRGGPEHRRRPRPDGSETAGTRWVHTEPAGKERNGHQRSPGELRNRRSDRQRSRHQAPLQEAGQSSSLPTRLPRALGPLARETVVTEDGLPYGRAGSHHHQVEPSPLFPGRATHVQ